MNQNPNQSDYNEAYSSLPSTIQDFLNSEDLVEIIKNISILAKLNLKQNSRLSYIIGDVLIGKLSIKEFAIKIKSFLEIADPQAQIINEIVNKKIFEPLKIDLNQLAINKQKPAFIPAKTVAPLEKEKTNTTPPVTTNRPKTIEELIYKTKPVEESPKEEPQKPQPTPEVILPEIPEIKIERPVNKTGELKRVSAPSVSPEEQTKIHSKLLEAIKKKESTPKIVEQIKKIIESGPKVSSKEKPPPKTPVKAEEPTASKVIGGENSKKFDAAEEKTDATKKPYIFDVKLKEGEKEKSTKSEEPIVYKKYQPQKPFGEA